MQGWIKLQRKIQDHWIYQEKRVFSRYEAWLDLIMLANHKDNKVLIDGKLKDVARGEFVTSIRKLCDRWDWSNTKVTTFLKLLESDEMITYKSDTKKTVVTIVNYGLYHDKDNEEATQKRHRNTSETYQKHTNKNVKNVKKKDYTSKMKKLLTYFSSIENFNQINKEYWNVIRETRKTGRIANSVIYNTMKKWQRFDLVVVEYALKSHIEAHAGKREEYTIGIMRNTDRDEAEDRLNKVEEKSNVIGFQKSKDQIEHENMLKEMGYFT